MASGSQKFQPPKGTRDFYPPDMAVRRYIEGVWRKVSINHGFDEVEGPMFEHLDLYTHKSGPGIVSEIFQVFSGKDEAEVAQIRGGKPAPYALRPEFTPTLARMVASEAASLPRPIKWFAIPQHFRAESPQRGRLREFGQWNVDFIGEESPKADAEVIATAVAALQAMRLSPDAVKIRVSDRNFIALLFTQCGVDENRLPDAFELLDKRGKMQNKEFEALAAARGIDPGIFDRMSTQKGREQILGIANVGGALVMTDDIDDAMDPLVNLFEVLESMDVEDWCEVDHTIVRGLAYYTGTVFEIHEATGAERAIAGGGRYDKLIESFGGPSLPACGFGMGDVVLGNILRDKGLLKDEIIYEPIRPDAFVISNGDEIAEKQLPQLVASLRRDGFHVRHTYKSTRNVGKLLGDAGKYRARYAIILGKELNEQPARIALKNLDSGEQREVALSDLPAALKRID